jgi:hypothetical protein
MQQVFISLLIQFEILQNPAVVIFIILCLIGILVSIGALVTRPNSMQAYRKNLFHKHYGDKTFLMVLVSTLALDGLLLMGVLINRYIFYVSCFCPVVVLMYTVCRRPFKLMWNNIRLAIIQLCILGTIILQILTMHTEISENCLFSIGVFTFIVIAVFVTIFVLVFKLIKLLKKTIKN